jgi:triacylglycerol lipase
MSSSIYAQTHGSPQENLGLGRIIADTKATTTVTDTTKHVDDDATTETKKKKLESKIESSSLSASLAALPASFTTFLLSILDSPAYGNLRTSYCNGSFNAQTPDDPNVRYFSVAGRAPSVNIWHPFWLPKMVVDNWEREERERLKAAGHPDAKNDAEWGNDGLVTVRSARWGEFLGTIEGCDHWEIRGARGIELDIDIPSLQSVSLSIPSVSLRDWDLPKWLSGWRKDTGAKSKAQAMENMEVEAVVRRAAAAAAGAETDRASSVQGARALEMPQAESSSTERLSAVFNWVAEHTPEAVKVSSSILGKGGVSAEDLEAAAQGTNRSGERNELATKADLERFYVALCRKLYDEGL